LFADCGANNTYDIFMLQKGREEMPRMRKKDLQAELEKYRGKWVAIKNGRIVASGETAFSAYRKVKDKKDIQLLKKVPSISRAELLF